METAASPPRTSLLRQIGRGALICLGLGLAAAVLAVLGRLQWDHAASIAQLNATFWSMGLLQLCIYAAMLLLTALGQRRLPARGWRRWTGLGALVLANTAVGWALFVAGFCPGQRLLGVEPVLHQCRSGVFPADWVPVMLARQLQFALLFVGLSECLARSRNAAAALHAAGLRRLRLAAELDAAQAQLLQAQIEPHFLFNTLANVRRLLRTEPAAAATMLADLLRYLEQALPQLREQDQTLASEAELVRAYLAVQGVRMGARLRYEIAVPAGLAQARVPAMLLLTLVENALKHGLQPLAEGGLIQVGASQAEGVLTLTVADTGRGMGEGSGHGMGLANIRARLRALYGARAGLSLRLNEPRGLCATVTLPGVGA